MIPHTTATAVAKQAPVLAEEVQRPQRVGDEAVVSEDRLPGQRPDQVGDEERRDDREQEQVLHLPPRKAIQYATG